MLRPSHIGKYVKSVIVNISRSTSSISLSASISSHAYADNDTESSVEHGAVEKLTPACNWQAPSDWDIASNKSHGSRVSSDATPTFDDMFVCEPDAKTLSDFQRFIRRMEKAGPEIILSHLNRDVSPEDFDHPEREGEIEVERHLWALTALQLQNMENSLVPNQGVGPLMGLPTLFRQPKRALELYSNLGQYHATMSRILLIFCSRGLPAVRRVPKIAHLLPHDQSASYFHSSSLQRPTAHCSLRRPPSPSLRRRFLQPHPRRNASRSAPLIANEGAPPRSLPHSCTRRNPRIAPRRANSYKQNAWSPLPKLARRPPNTGARARHALPQAAHRDSGVGGRHGLPHSGRRR